MKELLKKIENLQENLSRKHLDIIIFIIIPSLIFLISQSMLGSKGIFSVEKPLIIFNILIMEAIAFIFLGIFRRMRAALLSELILICLFTVANNYVRAFRGNYIMPWDLIAIRTAVNVAGRYNFAMDGRTIAGTVAFIILAVLIFIFVSNKKIQLSVPKRLLSVIIPVCFLAILGGTIKNEAVIEVLGIHDSMFAQTKAYTGNGMMFGFLFKLQRLFVERPEGYSKAYAKELLDSMVPDENVKSASELPDIIVVMNEAFSDLRADGEFETDKDYMPFIHSLPGKENTVTGKAHVSVLGGLTPNSEFEFLTGYSMAFLPENSIPFQMYVRRKMDALPWYLTSSGYFSLAMHPYNSSGWDRTIAWPLLGFQETCFIEDFAGIEPEPKKIRDYISDEALYDEMIRKLDSRDNPEQPMFAFDVTMQNHSPYSKEYDHFTPEIHVKNIDDMENENNRSLTNYLSLIYESDKAFEKLIKHYEQADRDTIILMFGDHQPDPDVAEPIYTMNGIDVNNLSEEDIVNDHIVPFVIWANFDIEEKKDVEISLNYLGNLLLKEAGIPLTRYRSFSDKTYTDYPYISAIGGERSDNSFASPDALKEELKDLSILQYYEMFDDDDEYQ